MQEQLRTPASIQPQDMNQTRVLRGRVNEAPFAGHEARTLRYQRFLASMVKPAALLDGFYHFDVLDAPDTDAATHDFNTLPGLIPDTEPEPELEQDNADHLPE